MAYARPDDVDFQRYARASFLVAWDGGPSSLLLTPPSPRTTIVRPSTTPAGRATTRRPSSPARTSSWFRPVDGAAAS